MDCIDHGRRASHAYGYTKVRGVYLHRSVYADTLGIPVQALRGLVVRHTCDNPRCINPDHLIHGTHQDNVQDRVDRDRTPKGEAHCCAKLTEAQVLDIRSRYIPRCRVNGTRALGREFGVHQYTISEIVRGETWQHL